MADTQQPDPESLRLELNEAITAFHNQLTLMTQSIGLIITADTLLLAYGFTQRRSAIFLLASLLPIAMLIMFIEVMAALVPISYIAMKLERKPSLGETALISSYARSDQGVLPALLRDIEKSDGANVPHFTSKIPPRLLLEDRKSLLLLLAFVVQLCLFVVSITAFNYQFM